VQLTQNYFTCYFNSNPGQVYRVTRMSYQNMTTYPYYRLRATCRAQQVTNPACLCPSGFSGSLCSTQQLRKCFADITNPNLAQGCTGQDSDDYVYSIKGFDPCHEFDFSKKFKLQYKLVCKDINALAQVIDGGHKEQIGFAYYDVVSNTSRAALSSGKSPIKYAAVNKKTNLQVMDGATLSFAFDFRDWKYLSNIKRFSHAVADAQVIAGLTENTIEIDFAELTKTDREKTTAFEVAGRVYFEATVFAPGYSSFTTNGFFDREGYVEPQRDANKLPGYLMFLLPAAAALLIVAMCCCYKRQ